MIFLRTSEEFQRALGKLRLKKAEGKSGVISEILVFGSPFSTKNCFKKCGVRVRFLLLSGMP